MDIGRMTAASESVKFAVRKIEDMLSSKAAHLSGATKLSGVLSELQSVQEMLKQLHCVIMNAQASWEDSQDTDPNDHNHRKILDVSKCTEAAIFTFMNKLVDIKPTTFAEIFKTSKSNPKPVNYFALYKLKVDIGEIRLQAGTINLGGHSDRANKQPAWQPPSNIDDIWPLGLEIYQKCILWRLVDQSIQTRSTVQVVGTEGFAKTAVAEKIYQSTEVKTHFDFCFWLFPQIRLKAKTDHDNVGYKHRTYLFNPIDIMRKMLLKLGVTNSLGAHNDDYNIMSQLRKSLNDKRCLVAVDNNWTELWTLVNAAFPDGNNGSRVLITTKKQGQTDYNYELPCEDDRNLLDMEDENQWHSKLPSVLKNCIAYTGAVFPCGSTVVADVLIRLWIVEGIIPHDEGRTMEDIAESYLDHLVQRGLVYIIRAYYHNQDNCPIRSIILDPRLHLIFESSRFTSDEKEFLPVKVTLSGDAFDSYNYPEDSDESHANLHRLALHLPYQFNHISSFEKGPKLHCFNHPSLHSLFFFGYVVPVETSPFSFLRVLAVFSSHIQFTEEYTQCWLDRLINLRYLGFIVCLVEGRSLGKTLDSLDKLEILDLSRSIVSGLPDQFFQDFQKNHEKVHIVAPAKEELPECWSPIPDMSQ